MSGLAVFFRDFLTGDESNGDYGSSINQPAHMNLRDDEDLQEVTGQEYLKEQKVIEQYLSRRLVDPEEQESNIDTGLDGSSDPTTFSSDPHSQDENHLETQPLFLSPSPRQVRSGPDIPYVGDTIHGVRRIMDVDLWTKKVSLELCTVTHVFGARKVHRAKQARFKQIKTVCRHDMLDIARFGWYQYDGPLFPAFRRALSMEFVQKEKSTAVQEIIKRPNQRMVAFFYDEYAKTIHGLCQRHAKHDMELSLKDVPAQCIFPSSTAHDWFDRYNLAEYCLCIGESGHMNAVVDDVAIEKPMRFDDPETRVWLNFRKENSQHVYLLQPNETGIEYRAIRQGQEHPFEVVQAPSQPRLGTNGASAGVSTQAVKYEKISDLENIFNEHKAVHGNHKECIVNLYAVVIGFRPPSLTKRGQWMLQVALVDDSLAEDNPNAVISINIFQRNTEQLPSVQCAGDVLRLHRVRVQQFNEEMQLMGKLSSSFVVFRGDHNNPTNLADFSASHAVRNEYQANEEELDHVQDLWLWGLRRILYHPTIKLSQSFQICDMTTQDAHEVLAFPDDLTGDMTVMIAAIIPFPTRQMTDHTPHGYLRLWDGTGRPASDPYPTDSPNLMAQGDPPADALVQISRIIDKLKSSNASIGLNLKAPNSLTGRVINAEVWEGQHWTLIQQSFSVGSFVRLRNVKQEYQTNGSMPVIKIMPKSGITPLPQLAFETIRLLEDHAERLYRGDPLNEQSGILPLQPENFDLQRSPLKKIERKMADEATSPCDRLEAVRVGPVPSTFEGLVQFLSIIPSIQNIREHGVRLICKKNNAGEERFAFAARLKDESGAVADVLCGGDFGIELLGSTAANALLDEREAMNALDNLMNEKETFTATIENFSHRGSKYLIAKSIER